MHRITNTHELKSICRGMAMFKKILYPTDFSDVAQEAIKYIDQLRDGARQWVFILHAIDSRVLDLLIYNPIISMEIEKNLREDAQSSMDSLRVHFEETGFEVETSIEVGIPASVILRTEEAEDVSIIAMGSHGKSNVREMILGSVSEEVIHSSRKPVLIVKRPSR